MAQFSVEVDDNMADDKEIVKDCEFIDGNMKPVAKYILLHNNVHDLMLRSMINSSTPDELCATASSDHQMITEPGGRSVSLFDYLWKFLGDPSDVFIGPLMVAFPYKFCLSWLQKNKRNIYRKYSALMLCFENYSSAAVKACPSNPAIYCKRPVPMNESEEKQLQKLLGDLIRVAYPQDDRNRLELLDIYQKCAVTNQSICELIDRFLQDKKTLERARRDTETVLRDALSQADIVNEELKRKDKENEELRQRLGELDVKRKTQQRSVKTVEKQIKGNIKKISKTGAKACTTESMKRLKSLLKDTNVLVDEWELCSSSKLGDGELK